MAIQTINIGQNVNDGTGDDLRTAFDKVNDNFTFLEGLGGETNTASNLGNITDGEAIFAGKVLQDLTFKRIKSSNTNNLTVTSDGESIILNPINPDQNAFGRVQDDSGDTITAGSPNSVFGIKGGSNVTTDIVGTDLQISASLNLVQDITPELGGPLTLNSFDIVGSGNINITGNITATGSLNVGNIAGDVIGDLKGSVFGNDSTPIVNGLDNTLNGDLTGDVTGNLTGNISGGLGSEFNLNAFGLRNDIGGDITRPDTAFIRLALGGFGSIGNYADLTAPAPNNPDASFIVRMPDISDAYFEKQGSDNNTLTSMMNYIHYIDSPLTDVGTEYGQIHFHEYKVNGTTQGMGYYGMTYDGNDHAFVAKPFRRGTFEGDTGEFKVNADGSIILDSIKIKDETITTIDSNEDLILDASGTGKVSFYGAYQFPETIGNAGEVLTVPLSGTLLEWGAGGGGGGGSSTFVGLSDTPASYAGGAADALKFVRVAASGTALEFVDVTSVVDGTYIATQGGLLTSGGTMTGDINLGTNNITNGGTLTATSFSGSLTGNSSGTHSGDVDSATNITTTNLFVTTVDTTDSSAVSFTPGVEMESFLTVKSSLNVLDTVTTKNLTSTQTTTLNDLIITGSLNVDNFNVTGSGNPTFTSGSDIVFDAAGQLTTNASIIPDQDGTVNIGSATFKFDNVYANTFNGNVTGNITGNLQGNVTGNIDGIVGGNTPAAVTGTTIIANTGFQGNLTGNVDADYVDAGNIRIEGNSIETANSNDNIRIAHLGTGYIELDSDVVTTGRTFIANNDNVTIGATSSPQAISIATYCTFITTGNWTAGGSTIANATLADGAREGQIKVIKLKSRGVYQPVSPPTLDRYVEISLTLNGASGTTRIGENFEYASITLIWSDNSWWIIGRVDS
jgi:hypothetical protein